MTVPRNKDKLLRNKKKPSGNRNRRVGHGYERLIAKEFRELLGFERTRTTRETSRLMDSAKIDLDYIPYNIQCKAVEANINYPTLLFDIEEAIKKLVPEREDFPLMIFHKRKKQELIIMRKSSLYKILLDLVNKGKESNKKQEKSV